jgi:hypothetical protein
MSAGIPTDDLAARLETAIRAVPGVSGVYAAAPAIAQAIGELPIGATSSPSLVRVESGASVGVTTVIGVEPSACSPDVADAVAATIRGIAGEDARVTVRVGRVAV